MCSREPTKAKMIANEIHAVGAETNLTSRFQLVLFTRDHDCCLSNVSSTLLALKTYDRLSPLSASASVQPLDGRAKPQLSDSDGRVDRAGCWGRLTLGWTVGLTGGSTGGLWGGLALGWTVGLTGRPMGR